MQNITSVFSRINNIIYNMFSARVEKPDWNLENEFSSFRKQLIAEGYFSQAGQDKWLVENLFPGKTDGFFVDIGAHDGISFNNTYRLENAGWMGIAVEPNPSIYPLLRKNRKCITENCAVASHSGICNFRMINGHAEMLSGLIPEYDTRHVNRINKEIKQYGGSYSDISVQCRTLAEILSGQELNQIDYLSIDVEGAEYELLKSIDFKKIKISILSVENNYHDWKIPYLLIKMGFRFHSRVGDEFYINQRKPNLILASKKTN